MNKKPRGEGGGATREPERKERKKRVKAKREEREPWGGVPGITRQSVHRRQSRDANSLQLPVCAENSVISLLSICIAYTTDRGKSAR